MRSTLYVDYIYLTGHVNFNNIHIKAILEQDKNAKLVLFKRIARQLPYTSAQYALKLPNLLEKKDGHPFLNRIRFLITLIYIKIRVRPEKYKKVIVSSCDEITLGLCPLCRNMYIISHGNARNMANSLKRYFCKRLARHNTFIVFNHNMAQPFLKNGIHKLHIISHGCVEPTHTIQHQPSPKKHRLTIFHPSTRPEQSFIDQLTHSPQFLRFLREEDILLILRKSSPPCKGGVRGGLNGKSQEKNPNIQFINRYLTTQEYLTLFHQSDIILLAYPPQFKYMVSGVSYECVANKKNILILHNPSLAYCAPYYNYNVFFKDITQLCERITYLKNHPEATCIVSPQQLQPDYAPLYNNSSPPCKGGVRGGLKD